MREGSPDAPPVGGRGRRLVDVRGPLRLIDADDFTGRHDGDAGWHRPRLIEESGRVRDRHLVVGRRRRIQIIAIGQRLVVRRRHRPESEHRGRLARRDQHHAVADRDRTGCEPGQNNAVTLIEPLGVEPVGGNHDRPRLPLLHPITPRSVTRARRPAERLPATAGCWLRDAAAVVDGDFARRAGRRSVTGGTKQPSMWSSTIPVACINA